MTVTTWLLFCALETVLSITPGPAVLLVVSLGLTRGTAAGLRGALGILCANAMYFALSALGVGAAIAASERLFVVIKLVGAGYLVWIGVRMLFARASRLGAPASEEGVRGRSDFWRAVLVQGSNPKALLFFTALLPQFIDPARSVVVQVAILGVSSFVIEFFVLWMYAAASAGARRWANTKWLERLGGAFLVGAGVRMLWGLGLAR